MRPWWGLAVRREYKRLGIDQKELARRINADPPEVSRAISGQQPILEVVLAISDELKLPFPVLLPDSEAEANHLAMQRRLFKRDLQFEEITAGVAETPTESHTKVVPLENAIRERKQGRRRQRNVAPAR